MKKIILISFILLCVAFTQAQTKTDYGKLSQQTVKTSNTYSWASMVENKDYKLDVLVGFEIATVNTSDLHAALNIYGSFTGSASGPKTLLSTENYTFTQTSGVNSTIEAMEQADFMYKYLLLTVVAQSVAQTSNVTPWIKTVLDEN